MAAATHALFFYKDNLEPNARVAPDLEGRHRFAFVARGSASAGGKSLAAEQAVYGDQAMALEGGAEGAEIWRWELAPHDATPIIAEGVGVASQFIVAREIATLGLGTRPTWLFRCDGTEMAPGSVALTHLHAGPGLRCMIEGSMTVEQHGVITEHKVGDWWYETNVDPVVARSTDPKGTRFIRIMVLPAEFKGFPSVHFLDPADYEKLKNRHKDGRGRWLCYVDQVVEL